MFVLPIFNDWFNLSEDIFKVGVIVRRLFLAKIFDRSSTIVLIDGVNVRRLVILFVVFGTSFDKFVCKGFLLVVVLTM